MQVRRIAARALAEGVHAGFLIGTACGGLAPNPTDRCVAWARETFIGSGRYVNYLDADETGDPSAAAYGPNYGRLQELKGKYDPDNFFHINQNIRPDP